jgi:hypothetical protein
MLRGGSDAHQRALARRGSCCRRCAPRCRARRSTNCVLARVRAPARRAAEVLGSQRVRAARPRRHPSPRRRPGRDGRCPADRRSRGRADRGRRRRGARTDLRAAVERRRLALGSHHACAVLAGESQYVDMPGLYGGPNPHADVTAAVEKARSLAAGRFAAIISRGRARPDPRIMQSSLEWTLAVGAGGARIVLVLPSRTSSPRRSCTTTSIGASRSSPNRCSHGWRRFRPHGMSGGLVDRDAWLLRSGSRRE